MERVIKIGTRGSKLALWQADYVADLLQQKGLQSEIVIIETKGDKILDRSLSKIGSKGVFTEELEDQLRTGGIDIAVHSAKDMQATLPEGFKIIAFTERELVNDVIVSLKDGIDLNNGKEVVLGTSSVRRVAMLKHYYPHVKVVDMRGNLQTRMRKLEEGQCDALVLAYAGVHRMHYEEHITQHLPLDQFTPAAGQGSVAIEVSENLDEAVIKEIRNAVNDKDTEYRLLAERSFLHTLQGGCSIPAFALANLEGSENISITGGLVRLDGSEVIKKTLNGSKEDAERLGDEVAQWILDNGGKELLAEIKQQK
ncbi:hydroxymethylbilane synthase [Sediminitomix flava]|uniref:Porphobilinogen deaminase n=1 Tax=Sediminitomix flava TaxID=379075 RepID=A0A315Z091_SEDFL|nr:hydroxymethylbilane synthase [Sediminitomix flava]PWJ36048.1 hydroxymethylbilane synthase [Sediminitomix flava]